MLCGNASWLAGLLCVCTVMSGPTGQPVGMSTVTPQTEGVSSEERMSTPAANVQTNSTSAVMHHVRQSLSLSAGEQEFLLKRKQVAVKSLNSLGIECTLDSVPHVALLGSGGGQRAAVGLVGSLYQMEKEGLLDTLLYLGGVSGSAWDMSSLYSDPKWSTNMDRAVSRLSSPGVRPKEVLDWLRKRAKDEHFSLTDIWGLITSAGIMKQLDLRHLSEDGMNAFNPYPIYSAVSKDCLQHGPEKAKWFEITPDEAGFTDLGFFINTSHLGNRMNETELKGQRPEMDMVQLQGIVGSAVADKQTLVNYVPDWLKGLISSVDTEENNLLDEVFYWIEAPQQINSFWDVLDRFMRGNHSLLKLIEEIRKNTADPTVLSDLDSVRKALKAIMNLNPVASKSPEQRKLILEQWLQKMLEPLETQSQSLDEDPAKQSVSWLVQKVIPLIGKWQWGTTENYLYQYPGAGVPSCIRLKEQLQLVDAGLMLNTPYPPFLGQKRDTDLLIALDFGADDTFKILTLAREYAEAVKKPFPEIDNRVLEDKDWPRDCYVFTGKVNEPTIVYMPLFNRRNCKDAKEVKAKMEEFSTFQLPFSQEKIEFVLETAKANIKNNKDTLVMEIQKAVLRRNTKM